MSDDNKRHVGVFANSNYEALIRLTYYFYKFAIRSLMSNNEHVIEDELHTSQEGQLCSL